jgi:putative DNA-invertase from lambdoid prophage Rac
MIFCFRETVCAVFAAKVAVPEIWWLKIAFIFEIGAILVTELSRWGRSTQDLVQTLDDLQSCNVSVIAQTSLSFDLSTASGKLMRTIMASLAEFERDLIEQRFKSGLIRGKAVSELDGHFVTKKGIVRRSIGRQAGERPSDEHVDRVLATPNSPISSASA